MGRRKADRDRPETRPDLERVREFARQRVEQSSLRAVAPEIGVATGALHKFIAQGVRPKARTWALYAAWYREQDSAGRATVDDPAYRDIPVDALRDFARQSVQLSSLRVFADACGMPLSTLHAFLAGKKQPQAQVRRRLGMYYLSRQGEPGPSTPRVRRPPAPPDRSG